MTCPKLDETLERIADSLEQYVKLEAQRFEKEYPVKRVPVDATITHVPNDEDQLRESLGSTGEETQEDWEAIGSRERDFLARESAKESPSKSRSSTKRLPPKKTRRK